MITRKELYNKAMIARTKKINELYQYFLDEITDDVNRGELYRIFMYNGQLGWNEAVTKLKNETNLIVEPLVGSSFRVNWDIKSTD